MALKDTLNRFWNGNSEKSFANKFNEVFYQFLGGQSAQYDYKNEVYLKKGYKVNPIVNAVINQMVEKTKAVPYTIKKVKDVGEYQKLQNLNNATSGNYSIKQLSTKYNLETKAYEDKELPLPLLKPI